jgi:osomolarity two-component system phosphorelay intermediate protein YPD1
MVYDEQVEMHINMETLNQLFEMDDDPQHSFSKSIILDYVNQATSTFDKMKQALDSKDLEQYAKLGHFLKGSSATIGLTKVEQTCEKIQHIQASADDASLPAIDTATALTRGAELLTRLRREYDEAIQCVCKIYEVNTVEELL